MKYILIVIFWSLFSIIKAQEGSVDLTLKILDTQGRPMANTEVEFVELSTNQKKYAKTDPSGVVKILLEGGKVWQYNIKDIRNYYDWQIEVKEKQKRTANYIKTYDFYRYERETRPFVDRRKLNFQVEKQNFDVTESPSNDLGIIKIQVLKSNKTPLMHFPIQLTCYKTEKMYVTKTNAAGIATFKVPLKNDYEIDIDGIPSYSYVDFVQEGINILTKTITYEPTVIQETNQNDTITQTLPPDLKNGTSARVYVKITAKGAPDNNGLWANEPIYLRQLNGKLVFQSITNQKGVAEFLLPKGFKYMIDFRYLKNVDVVNLTRDQGIAYNNRTIIYKPNPRYQYPELYIPKPDYFSTDYFHHNRIKFALPKEDNNVEITPYFAFPANNTFKEAILNLALAATQKDAEADYQNVPPVHIVFVVDVSGSMAADNRLDNVREMLSEIIKTMRPKDKVALITFSDHANVIFPLTTIEGNQEKLLFLISRLVEEGSTNIYDGLQLGFKELEKNYKPNIVNQLVLLTDGYENTKSDAEVVSVARNYYSGPYKLTCSTIGVGPDFNEPLLRQIATAGAGSMAIALQSTDLKNIAFKRILSHIFPIAKDVTIEVQYPKMLEYYKVWGSDLKEKKEGTIIIKTSNLFKGSELLSMVKFRLININKDIENQPIKIRVKYYDLRKKQNITVEKEVTLKWMESSNLSQAFHSQEEKNLFLELSLKQILQDACGAFHKKEIGKAKTILEEGLKDLEQYQPDWSHYILKPLKTQADEYLEILKGLR
ncbi:MAG: hypothetical protein KatS3mg035_1539 [Bacteroidia bacterium]|nr:MAG: hypothetical protein KatS3mg035_1539 [Bacteroidia bacterium]